MRPLTPTGLSLCVLLAAACQRAPTNDQAAISREAGVESAEPAVALEISGRAWELGQGAAYHLKLKSQIALAPGAYGIDFDLTGTLEVVPVSVDEGRVSLFFRVQDGRFESHIPQTQREFDTLARQLDGPYFATLSGGLLTQTQLLKEMSPLTAGAYRTIASAFQFARPVKPLERWTATEHDSTGEYVAEYQASGGPSSWRKRKVQYRHILAMPGADPHVMSIAPEITVSTGEIALSDNGVPNRVTAEDELLLKGAQSPIRSRIVLDLERDPRKAAPTPPANWQALRDACQTVDADVPYASGVSHATLDDARIGGLSYDQITAGLRKIAAEKGASSATPSVSGDDSKEAQNDEAKKLFSALAATFRRRPETISRALADIRAGSPIKNVLIDALASGGSPSAQDAIIEVIRSTSVDARDRLASVISISRTMEPTDKSVETLKELLNDKNAGTQALYGLGTFSRRLRDIGQVERAKRIGDFLIAQLDAAQTELQITRALRAISNSGYAAALPKLKALLTDPREQVRVDAVRAARSMHESDVDRVLCSRLKEDASANVRLAAIDAAQVREPSETLVSGIVGATADTEPHVRYRALELLVQWLPRQPELRATIEKAASQDGEERIRSLAKAAL